MRRTNIALTAIAAILVTLCYLSVQAPVRFDQQRRLREAAVKQRLLRIRDAAERYRHDHGAYTARLQTLVDSLYLADSLQYIPYSDGRRFHLTASTATLRSGRAVPVMECSATYDEFLNGLDADEIRQLDSKAQAAGRFAGLKIGDLETPNGNTGNWE